ncbi:MAG: hypothetical protein RL368_2272 [Pseudomonadota bacterium]|jgi:phosphate acetyltransferase/phosphate butyryltransferase
MELVENKTYDEINIGDSVSLNRTLTQKDINLFALVSGDTNPTHIDMEYASHTSSHKLSGHSMWMGALISNLLGNDLPGAGTVYRSQFLQFFKTISMGDTVTITVTAKEKRPEDHLVVFDCTAINSLNNELICGGTAEVIAPTEKISRPKVALPNVHMNIPGSQLRRLIEMTKAFAPIRMAVVHPVDQNSILGAVEAAKANLIIPVLIGPKDKILAAAQKENVDISGYELINTEHSHEAARISVAMARAGEVDAIMKGSLHTDELMREAVQRGTGISTSRRMSHVFMMDVPSYPRPLFVTDAAINIDPSFEDKCDIIQSAIELAHALGNMNPKVALLSAVETVNPKLRSTMEAAAICKMAHRKQIVGGIIDGPLAFDNAVSMEAVEIKGIESEVAGQADILVVPDLESGNMLAKQLEYMADAQSSGIVLGARVPMALTSRADTVLSRMASCALALLLVRNKKVKAKV